ncbi:uncharacterized protein LOC110250311 [Exaiptasia diaphana]|uniref:Uncharacterized protein n=1 Tax=Exaiptasia diaphana TaxID=2652724 RepID=A0A913Y014_EXADI|nr:uncharacterized protein LOC110250311 [Exaiptasia diaphana]
MSREKVKEFDKEKFEFLETESVTVFSDPNDILREMESVANLIAENKKLKPWLKTWIADMKKSPIKELMPWAKKLIAEYNNVPKKQLALLSYEDTGRKRLIVREWLPKGFEKMNGRLYKTWSPQHISQLREWDSNPMIFYRPAAVPAYRHFYLHLPYFCINVV